MTPPKAADMAGWGEPTPEHGKPLPCRYCGHDPASVADAIEHAFEAHIKPAMFGRRPSLLRRFMRRVWRRG